MDHFRGNSDIRPIPISVDPILPSYEGDGMKSFQQSLTIRSLLLLRPRCLTLSVCFVVFHLDAIALLSLSHHPRHFSHVNDGSRSKRPNVRGRSPHLPKSVTPLDTSRRDQETSNRLLMVFKATKDGSRSAQ